VDRTYLEEVVAALSARGVTLEVGLTSEEFTEIEERWQLRFPPDLRSFLGFALPVSDRFPNWRGDGDAITERLASPRRGIVFDVEQGTWLDEWGDRPPDDASAHAKVLEQLAAAPMLIPVYAHRFIPAEPAEVGNPIFSVWQTDVIYYGNDLPEYFEREFRIPKPDSTRADPRWIPFWSPLAEAR
jgi:hypothetical protein